MRNLDDIKGREVENGLGWDGHAPRVGLTVDEIAAEVAKKFPTFGRGSTKVHGNPIASHLADRPPMFALGVDVRQVVEFVLSCKDK